METGERDFEQISEMIKKEMDRFERTRIKDFKETLVKYLEALMLHQQQVKAHCTFLIISEPNGVQLTAHQILGSLPSGSALHLGGMSQCHLPPFLLHASFVPFNMTRTFIHPSSFVVYCLDQLGAAARPARHFL